MNAKERKQRIEVLERRIRELMTERDIYRKDAQDVQDRIDPLIAEHIHLTAQVLDERDGEDS